mgnify:CR=1 FL=1
MNRHVAKRRVPRTMARLLIAGALLAATLPVAAQSLLIRGATVHTAGAQGSLQNTDVLVQGVLDRLRELGAGGVRELAGEPENMVFALPRELRLQLVD